MDIGDEGMELRKQKKKKQKAVEDIAHNRGDTAKKQKKKENDGKTATGEELVEYNKHQRFEDEFIICDEIGGITSKEIK